MSKPKYLIACLLILFLLIPAAGCGQNSQAVDPDKMLTEYTKPAVVRVVSFNMATYYVTSELANFLGIQTQLQYYDGGTGSGAIIAENGYIVTNAHVVETAKLDDKAAKDRLDKVFLADIYAKLKAKENDQYAKSDLEYARSTSKRGDIKKTNKVILPGGDNFNFDIKSYGAPIGEGKDIAVVKIDATNLPIVNIDESDKAQTSDKLVIAGYPGKADLSGFLDNNSALVSTYTNGAIAARKSSENGPILQLDANINPGNSGGPIFSKDGKVIGIATATSSDGIGWAIPSTTLLEFARQAGAAINTPGIVTQRWQEGLQLYWQEHYKKAIPKFEEVQRLSPKHYAITDYLSKSQKAISEGKNRLDLNDYLPFIIGFVLVVMIFAVIIFFFVIKKKKKNIISSATVQPETPLPPNDPPEQPPLA